MNENTLITHLFILYIDLSKKMINNLCLKWVWNLDKKKLLFFEKKVILDFLGIKFDYVYKWIEWI